MTQTQTQTPTPGDSRVVELLGVGAFLSLLEPRRRNASSGDASAVPMYEVTLLFPPSNTKQIEAINTAMALAARDKFGEKIPSNLRLALRKGDEKANYNGFAGNFYVTARSKDQPLVLAWREKRPATKADVVPGYTMLVQARAFGYDRNGNKGVSFGLQAVWVTRHGERLDGRPSRQQLSDGLGAGMAEADIESAEEVEEALAAAGGADGGSSNSGGGNQVIPPDLAAIMAQLSKTKVA
jgi:hypothetical protein